MDRKIIELLNAQKRKLGIKTYQKLADLSGVSCTTVQNILKDEGYNPTYKNLCDLLQALDIPILEDFQDNHNLNLTKQILSLSPDQKIMLSKFIKALKET